MWGVVVAEDNFHCWVSDNFASCNLFVEMMKLLLMRGPQRYWILMFESEEQVLLLEMEFGSLRSSRKIEGECTLTMLEMHCKALLAQICCCPSYSLTLEYSCLHS